MTKEQKITRADAIAVADGVCDWCCCPVGRKVPVAVGGLWAEETKQLTPVTKVLFRTWHDRAGMPVAPPMTWWWSKPKLGCLWNGDSPPPVLCTRCLAMGKKGKHPIQQTPEEPNTSHGPLFGEQ